MVPVKSPFKTVLTMAQMLEKSSGKTSLNFVETEKSKRMHTKGAETQRHVKIGTGVPAQHSMQLRPKFRGNRICS